ncbi:hypothetical protein DPMN_026686 [Dreissena polymorpha]|uniref:Uncharacterized protein n=1 Tax=Dreissena polymorpha TaxID=45954 RepID=A0A9D4LVP2_DREPO|nr:hypothetical protein DPMN_026686 [Dreissena polymorpha]
MFFLQSEPFFELVQDIMGTNLLNRFHDDRTIYVASRALTSVYYSYVFQPTSTIFKLVQDIIGTNLLTKFHKDRTINAASRVLKRKMFPPHDGQKAITKAYHKHIVLS